MTDPIDSKHDGQGQSYRASIDVPVYAAGTTVVPHGADVLLSLAEDQNSGHFAGKTVLTVVMRSIAINGQTYYVNSTGITKASAWRTNQTLGRVGAGTGIGAAIGGLAAGGRGAGIGALAGAAAGILAQIVTSGERVRIPSETRLTFALKEDLPLKHENEGARPSLRKTIPFSLVGQKLYGASAFAKAAKIFSPPGYAAGTSCEFPTPVSLATPRGHSQQRSPKSILRTEKGNQPQMLNRVTIIGRTGQDAKSKAMANGRNYTRLSVATNKRYKDANGEWEEKTTWHQVTGYGPIADYMADIPTGSLVFIEGEIQYRDYQRQLESENGSIFNVKWPVTEIVVDRIQVFERKQQKQEQRGAA